MNNTTPKTKCIWCNKSLTPTGHSRLFGANHSDWEGRMSHKKCWIENELKGGKKRPPVPREQPKGSITINIQQQVRVESLVSFLRQRFFGKVRQAVRVRVVSRYARALKEAQAARVRLVYAGRVRCGSFRRFSGVVGLCRRNKCHEFQASPGIIYSTDP